MHFLTNIKPAYLLKCEPGELIRLNLLNQPGDRLAIAMGASRNSVGLVTLDLSDPVQPPLLFDLEQVSSSRSVVSYGLDWTVTVDDGRIAKTPSYVPGLLAFDIKGNAHICAQTVDSNGNFGDPVYVNISDPSYGNLYEPMIETGSWKIWARREDINDDCAKPLFEASIELHQAG